MATKTPAKNRKLETPRYKSFRLQKRIKSPKAPLPSVITLCRQTLRTLRQNKRYFIRFTLLYAFITLLFVQTAAGFANINQAKEELAGTTGGSLQTSLVLYATLVGSAGKYADQVVAVYQFILIVMFGLAAIYALRHMYEASGKTKSKVGVKESLYRGMGPLVPLLLVIAVLALQLLPLSIGTGLYSTVVTNGLAVTNVERSVWVLFVSLLAILTFYLLSGSIFSLFIVTLPDMTPLRALRASRELTRFRRMSVIRKLILLPIIIVLAGGLIMLPFILWLPSVAAIVFYLLSVLTLPLVLTYFYSLYRSML